MAQGGQAVEGSDREKMGDGGAACAGDVQGRDSASGDIRGKDGNCPKRERRVQGHRVGRDTVESLCSGD